MYRYLILFVMALTTACSSQPKVTSGVDITDIQKNPVIEGFINTQIGDDPWPQVGCLIKNGRTSCTGTLVAPNVVLTAGHCVVFDDELCFELFDGRIYGVTEIIRYPKNESYVFYNDVALLILDDFILDIEPIQIAQHNFMSKGHPIDVVGYSRGWKKHSKPNVFWYYGILLGEENLFKTLPYEASVWFGDSGGPAIATFNGDKYIVGVTSSLSIRKDTFITENSFARLDVIYDWLDDNIASHSVCEGESAR